MSPLSAQEALRKEMETNEKLMEEMSQQVTTVRLQLESLYAKVGGRCGLRVCVCLLVGSLSSLSFPANVCLLVLVWACMGWLVFFLVL